MKIKSNTEVIRVNIKKKEGDIRMGKNKTCLEKKGGGGGRYMLTRFRQNRVLFALFKTLLQILYKINK